MHAQFVTTIPYTRSRVFDGKGYRLTMVSNDKAPSHPHGPDIVINGSITGGKPYQYDEINDPPD